MDHLGDDMVFVISRFLRVQRDFGSLACVSKRFAVLLHTPLFLAPMEEQHLAPWRRVTHNGFTLEFVIEQTPELCLATVQQHGKAILYVKEQTTGLCLAAVQQSGWALRYVKAQTHELCLAAVQQPREARQFVINA